MKIQKNILNNKNSLWFAKVGFIVFIVLIVFKPLRNFIAEIFTFRSPEGKLKLDYLNSLEIKYSDFDNSKALQIASELYSAFNVFPFGTDEDKIISNFELIKNLDSLNHVRKSFGVKKYLGAGYSAILGNDFILDDWLKAELSEDSEAWQFVYNIYLKMGVHIQK